MHLPPKAPSPRTVTPPRRARVARPATHTFANRLRRSRTEQERQYVYRVELTANPPGSFWVSHGYDHHGDVPEGRLRPGKFQTQSSPSLIQIMSGSHPLV